MWVRKPSFHYSCNWYQNHEILFLESSYTSASSKETSFGTETHLVRACGHMFLFLWNLNLQGWTGSGNKGREGPRSDRFEYL